MSGRRSGRLSVAGLIARRPAPAPGCATACAPPAAALDLYGELVVATKGRLDFGGHQAWARRR
ncbi:hypothetical protein AB0I13_10475 [Streptomyces prasinus]|nr:hypothetical protein [Streptomyces prasinus]